MPDHGSGPSPLPSVDVGDFLRAADQGLPFVLLDVRNEEEARAWKVDARRPIETVHVPYFDFIEDEAGSVAKVPAGRDVIVICAHGGSSEMVAGLLADAGRSARSVTGGMIAYGEHLEPAAVPLDGGDASRFVIWQVNRRGKGCLSYIVGAHGEAVVIDPMKNVEWFEAFAAREGLRIVHVLDTHIHADHVSGGPALSARLGVPYSVSAGDELELRQPVTPFENGQVLSLGGATGDAVDVRAVSTPGHTPGSTSYLVSGRYLMTGDTLFVGSVGRPDIGGHLAEWGRTLFTTLTERLSSLGDEVLVLPAHYESVHDIGEDRVVSVRLGTLRTELAELRLGSAEDFVAWIRAAVRDPPESYAEIVRVNLGIAPASIEKIVEWEFGRNECAAPARRTPTR